MLGLAEHVFDRSLVRFPKGIYTDHQLGSLEVKGEYRLEGDDRL